jgi:hypothetical protein
VGGGGTVNGEDVHGSRCYYGGKEERGKRKEERGEG